MAKAQQFVLVIDGWPGDDLVDALFRRCGDAAVWRDPGLGLVEVAFDRAAATMVDGVVAAIRDLDAVGLPTARVRHDDDLVTLAIIAERSGRTHEAVRLWALRRSAPGGFPEPLTDGVSAALYPWSAVTPWMRERLGLAVADHELDFTAVNLALRLRELAPKVARMEAIRSLLVG